MFVRASRLRAAPGGLDALIDEFTGDIAAKLRSIPGNTGTVLLVDRRQGRATALSYWKDRAAMDASETAATGLRSQASSSTGATVEGVQRGEILIMESTAPPAAGRFVRAIQFSADPGQVDAGIAHMRSTVLPALKAVNGFRALICGADRDGGQGFVTTVWETEADRDASLISQAALRQDAIARFGAANVVIEAYESVHVDIEVPVTH
jgi:heme-degrading monooxygenase HmoA